MILTFAFEDVVIVAQKAETEHERMMRESGN